MKKIVRFLADYFGVTDDIRNQTREYIGQGLLQQSHWWNGGITYSEPINDVQNFSILYGEALIEGFSYPDIGSIRDKVYTYKKDGVNLQTDREVYGYMDKKTFYTVKVEDLSKRLVDPSSPFYGKKMSELRELKRIK